MKERPVPAGITETLRTLAAIHDELDACFPTAMKNRTPGPRQAERSKEAADDGHP